jgi:glycosyltransferase involved in cell wall biosynthesis
MKLSCVVPAYRDPYVIPTIKSLLDNSKLDKEMEVVVVLDGFWPEFKLVEDSRVIYVHLGKNRGMRGAINAGVSVARGEYILRSDQHCMFAPGYDKQLVSDMERKCRRNDWIMTCTRYFLDPEKWERMDIEPANHEKLVIQGGKKFSGSRWRSRDKKLKDKPITETMAMQGSMWIMPKSWWEKVIKELQTEGYGQMYQDSHEMIFKTWKAGGKMVLNKNTWFAHKHRSFVKGRHEGTKENPVDRERGWKYALDTWKDYYDKEIRPKWNI